LKPNNLACAVRRWAALRKIAVGEVRRGVKVVDGVCKIPRAWWSRNFV
jgi:hypothetical protein